MTDVTSKQEYELRKVKKATGLMSVSVQDYEKELKDVRKFENVSIRNARIDMRKITQIHCNDELPLKSNTQ